jgi:hypothetical protein
MATQAQARGVSGAMRRTVVTPTFAAGLGVVIAAVLVVTYPMARTVISFGKGPPAGGSPCPVKNCLATGGGGPGEPAVVKPGRKLVTPAPARAKTHGSALAPSGQPSRTGTLPPGGAAVQYLTAYQWQNGFVEEVVISPAAGSPSANWQLLVTYSSAHIFGVGGANWVPEGEHTVLVKPGGPGGQPPPGGASIRVYLFVTGSPGPPSGCSFDGQPCRSG